MNKEKEIKIVENENNYCVIEDDDILELFSYNSHIASIGIKYGKNAHIRKIYEDWDYSRTTQKHLYKFLINHCDLGAELINCTNKQQKVNNWINKGVLHFVNN